MDKLKVSWANDVQATDTGFKNIDRSNLNGYLLSIETFFPAVKGRTVQAEMVAYAQRYDIRSRKIRSDYYYRKIFCGLGDEFIDEMAVRIASKKSEMERMVLE